MKLSTRKVSRLIKSLDKVVLNKGRGGNIRLFLVKIFLWIYAGKDKTDTFFTRLPWLKLQIMDDLDAALRYDPAAESLEEIALCYPGFYATMVYRLAHELYLLHVPLLPRMMTEIAHSRTGIDIHPGASIGSPFFIDHGTGVVIGQTVVVGRDVRIYQGVTLGCLTTEAAHKLRTVKRHPTVGDGVVIYANATILGGDTVIGDGSVIGANAFVTGLVPPGTVVRGIQKPL